MFDWADLAMRQWPCLALLHSTPNGAYYGKDRRAAAMHATRMRAEGLRKGYPDISLPVARGKFIGLAIEMKRKGEQPTDEQWAYLDMLKRERHSTHVCYSAEEAIAVLRDYLILRQDDPEKPDAGAIGPSGTPQMSRVADFVVREG